MKEAKTRCPRGSVGAIIKDAHGRVLFILRATFPTKWACPAGHFEPGEEALEAVQREIKEETGLDAVSCKMLWHGVMRNPCRRGFKSHEWFVFSCAVSDPGTLTIDPQAADDARWVSRQDFAALPLSKEGVEKVWQDIIKKIPDAFWGP